MSSHLPATHLLGWRLGVRRACAPIIVVAVSALSIADLSAQRRSSGGSVRQTRNVDQSGSSSRSTSTRNTNVNRDVNVGNDVTVNRNVNVNNNVNVNRGYGGAYPPRGGVVQGEEGAVAVGRRGAVAVGEEGAAAVGRYGAAAVSEEGYVGVGRYGGVVAGEHYESHAGWAAAAGVATGIAIGTMLARPPAASTTVIVSGATYMYSDGAYYEKVMYGGDVQYRVVPAPAGAIITMLPGGCTTVVRGGVSYSQCGGTYYQRVSAGYRVVVF